MLDVNEISAPIEAELREFEIHFKESIRSEWGSYRNWIWVRRALKIADEPDRQSTLHSICVLFWLTHACGVTKPNGVDHFQKISHGMVGTNSSKTSVSQHSLFLLSIAPRSSYHAGELHGGIRCVDFILVWSWLCPCGVKLCSRLKVYAPWITEL